MELAVLERGGDESEDGEGTGYTVEGGAGEMGPVICGV